MQVIARHVDNAINGSGEPKRNGFVLLTFPFGDKITANYVSNAKRADMVAALKEVLARWEGQPESEGHA
jgi:hypothetical protein